MRDITTMRPVQMRFGQGRVRSRNWTNVTLGSVSLILISAAVALTPGKVKLSPSAIDRDTFTQRYVEEGMPVAMARVRTIPIARTPVEIAPDDTNVTELPLPVADTKAVLEPRRYRIRQSKRGGDVCQRHGMKKVMVGKFKWRCRR